MALVALGGTRPPEPNKSRPLAWRRVQIRPAMPRVPQLPALLLLAALAATAWGQEAVGSQQLEPWLIGLTAVVVFLFVVFVMLLVGRLWRLRTRRKDEDSSEQRSIHSLEQAAYSNAAAEKERDDEQEKSKATSL